MLQRVRTGRPGYMTVDEIECIEEGGTELTIALLRRLAAALDSGVHMTAREACVAATEMHKDQETGLAAGCG